MAQYTFDTLDSFEKSKVIIPNEYQLVEYLESNGGQVIDTNVVYSDNNLYDIRQNITPLSTSNYFGTNGRLQVSMGLLAAYLRTKIKITQTMQSLPYCITYINDTTLVQKRSDSGYGVGYGYCFFSLSGWGGSSIYDLHDCEIIVNNVLVRKFYPVYRKVDNIAGMYDVVNNVFYANQGTGAFSVGSDFPTPNYQNGDTCTITELNLTMTYNDGYFWIADNQSLTLSQANQLFSFAKGDNGVTVTVTSTGGVYKYDGDEWQLWYTIIPPLVFRGFSFEQTDYWQKPEMVFRGFSFEITDKVGGSSMFHGMV